MTPEVSSDLPLGTLIAGRFRLDRNLGSGGMADVFAATDLATKRSVAVKLLKKDVAQNAEATARLRREGEVLKQLDHPAIVALETFGKLEDGRLFIAMELLSGETLGERIRKAGRLEPSELAPILAGACSGLHAAHDKGIVHRDLKPDNIFLAEGPQGLVVKLLDFGISKVTGSDKLTQTGEVLGTPRYMAPEQLSAERDLDGRTDVYALGVILYEALAGSPPFLAATPTDLIVAILHGKHAPLRSFRPDLSAELEAVITRAMSRAREARYADAQELADAFLSVAQPAPRMSVPGEPRNGMTTAPMGSVGDISGEHPIDPPSPASPPREPDLRPGTFSELAASPVIATPVEPAAAAPERPRAPAGAHPAISAADASGAHGAIGASAPAPRREPTVPYQLPTKSNRTWLVVAATLAGAISAGIAIVALKMAAEDDAPPQAAQAPAPEVAQPATAPAEAPPAAPEPEVEAPSPMPEGVEPPAAEEPDDEVPSARRHHRARRETATTMSVATTQESASGGGTERRSAAELMRDARAALRDGDPRACVTLVERAMESGASSLALRLRGDCLVRAGDREEGLKSYERFCRLAPDHPSISEVRALVESLGGRCN